MNQRYRLSDKELFRRVRHEGRSWSNQMVVICAQPNDLGHNRYGFSVSRRIGKAVVRNRVRRLLREAVRLRHHAIQPGWDIVVVARGAVTRAPLDVVDRAVTQLLGRAALLIDQEHEENRAGID